MHFPNIYLNQISVGLLNFTQSYMFKKDLQIQCKSSSLLLQIFSNFECHDIEMFGQTRFKLENLCARKYIKQDESVASSATALESLVTTLLIDVYGGRDVTVCDVQKTYLQATLSP